jgi:hypothetical protein
MSRGGARNRSGPQPDPNSLRSAKRRDLAGFVVLPEDGREDPTPLWPLTTPSDRECELWDRLWAYPQAIEWERLGQELEVALYVRRLAEVEQPEATAALAGLVHRLAEGLGLTVNGLRINRWLIGSDRSPVVSVIPATPPGPSAKERMQALRHRYEETA